MKSERRGSERLQIFLREALEFAAMGKKVLLVFHSLAEANAVERLVFRDLAGGEAKAFDIRFESPESLKGFSLETMSFPEATEAFVVLVDKSAIAARRGWGAAA